MSRSFWPLLYNHKAPHFQPPRVCMWNCVEIDFHWELLLFNKVKCNYFQYSVCSILCPPVKHFFPHLDSLVNVKFSCFQESGSQVRNMRVNRLLLYQQNRIQSNIMWERSIQDKRQAGNSSPQQSVVIVMFNWQHSSVKEFLTKITNSTLLFCVPYILNWNRRNSKINFSSPSFL